MGELKTIGLSDVRELFDEEGRMVPIHKLPDHVGRAIASIEVVSKMVPGSDPVEIEYVHKIKLWPKTQALELLARHLGMLNDKLIVGHVSLDALLLAYDTDATNR